MKYVLLLLLAGCLVEEKDYGPTAHVSLSCGFTSARDQDENPYLQADDTTHQFPISIEIDVTPGTEVVRNSTSDTYYPVTAIDAAIGSTHLTYDDFDDTGDGSYSQILMSKAPVTLPASAAGTNLDVSFDLQDSRGLHTNTLAFSVELDAN